MPSLTITSDAIQVHVDFNGYESAVNYHKTSFKRRDIYIVNLTKSDVFVSVEMVNGESFDLSFVDTVGTLTVGNINGVVPSSNEILKNMINTLVL